MRLPLIRLHTAKPFAVLSALGLAACALGLDACALGPDFTSPAPPAPDASYTARGEAAPPQARLGQKISRDWWTLFGSSELNDVIAMALENNQDLEAARATLDQVQHSAEAVAGLQYPQVGLHGGAVREKVNFTSYGMTFPPATLNLFSIGGTVSYALDLFGHERRMAESAAARAEAEGYRLNGAYLTLTGSVVMEALSAAALDSQIALVSGLVDQDQDRVALLRTARQAGAISDREMAEAEGQLAADAAQLPRLRAQLAAVRHALAVLVGKTPGEWSPPDFHLTSFTLPADIPLSLPSDLVRQRPDIMAAEADLHAATADVGAAEANRYPKIVLTADMTQWATLPGHLWQDAATGASLGGGITAPLFQGGKLEAEQRAAESAYKASTARYRQTVLQSFAQVATVLQDLVNDQDEVKRTGEAAGATSASHRFAELQRANGTLGILPVLDTQRQERLSKMTDIDARTRYLKDSAQLFLAMGGGWRNAQPDTAMIGKSD